MVAAVKSGTPRNQKRTENLRGLDENRVLITAFCEDFYGDRTWCYLVVSRHCVQSIYAVVVETGC